MAFSYQGRGLLPKIDWFKREKRFLILEALYIYLDLQLHYNPACAFLTSTMQLKGPVQLYDPYMLSQIFMFR